MPRIHEIILADQGDAFQVGIVLEEHSITTKDGTTSRFLCAFYTPDSSMPFQAKMPEERMIRLESIYTHGAEGFVIRSEAYKWAKEYRDELNGEKPDAATPS
jgi:hypothetical protein